MGLINMEKTSCDLIEILNQHFVLVKNEEMFAKAA